MDAASGTLMLLSGINSRNSLSGDAAHSIILLLHFQSGYSFFVHLFSPLKHYSELYEKYIFNE